jgi:transcriptional regulator with PAS, ATPase and Fis domain
METAIIRGLESFTRNDTASENKLMKRIEELEREKDQYKLAARETFLQSEAKYQAMLESVDAQVTLVDRNSMILWANEKAKEIFGRDIVGKSCCDALYGKKELCGDASSCMTKHAKVPQGLFPGMKAINLLLWLRFTRTLLYADRLKVSCGTA